MSSRIPNVLEVSTAVALVTFKEILRDKVLYNVLFCGVLLLGFGFLASQLSFIRPERILLDFGHSAIAASCSMIAVFLGAGLIGREFERRTVHLVLSRPVERSQFILGKFLGICGVIATNWALLCVAYVGILLVLSPNGSSPLQGTLLCSLLLALLQSFVLVAASILFSTFTTTSLAAIFTIGTFLVGVNISHLHALVAKLGVGWKTQLLDGTIRLLPDLERFDLGLQLTYGLPVSAGFMLLSVGYAVVVCSILLVLAGLLIRAKDL
jgi:Cu-processing system permease protein